MNNEYPEVYFCKACNEKKESKKVKPYILNLNLVGLCEHHGYFFFFYKSQQGHHIEEINDLMRDYISK